MARDWEIDFDQVHLETRKEQKVPVTDWQRGWQRLNQKGREQESDFLTVMKVKPKGTDLLVGLLDLVQVMVIDPLVGLPDLVKV